MLGRTLKIASVLFLITLTAAAATIPAGTKFTVRLDSEISSRTARAGQTFSGTLVRGVTVDGNSIAKAGALAKVKVTYAKSSGRLHDPGELTLRVSAVEIDGKMVPLATSAYHAKGKSHTKGNVEKIGGGAAAGALIGGIAGGGKGALIGTALGAGAGTGVAAATGKEEAVIHGESTLTFSTIRTTSVK